MASFTNAGRIHVGATFAVNGGAAAVLPADTLTVNGVKLSVSEWMIRGRLRVASVSGFITTFLVTSDPNKESTQAGG